MSGRSVGWGSFRFAGGLTVLAILAPSIRTCHAQESALQNERAAVSVLVAADFGVELLLSTAKQTYVRGEPVFVKVMATNTSKRIKRVTALEGGWENASGLQFNGRTPRGKIRHFYGTGADETYSVSGERLGLKPGARTIGEFEVVRHTNIGAAGAYTFFVTWLCVNQGKETRVRSDTISFTVREPTQEERLQYETLAAATGGARILLEHCVDSSLREIVRKFPESVYAPYVHYELAERASKKNDYQEAIARYRTVADQDKPFPLIDDALVKLAECYYRQGQQREAVEMLDKLIEGFDDSEQLKRARAFRKRVLQESSEDTDSSEEARALLRTDEGKPESMTGDRKEARAIEPASTDAFSPTATPGKAHGPSSNVHGRLTYLVIGLIVGIAIGAASAWFLLRKRTWDSRASR